MDCGCGLVVGVGVSGVWVLKANTHLYAKYQVEQGCRCVYIYSSLVEFTDLGLPE